MNRHRRDKCCSESLSTADNPEATTHANARVCVYTHSRRCRSVRQFRWRRQGWRWRATTRPVSIPSPPVPQPRAMPCRVKHMLTVQIAAAGAVVAAGSGGWRTGRCRQTCGRAVAEMFASRGGSPAKYETAGGSTSCWYASSSCTATATATDDTLSVSEWLASTIVVDCFLEHRSMPSKAAPSRKKSTICSSIDQYHQRQRQAGKSHRASSGSRAGGGRDQVVL